MNPAIKVSRRTDDTRPFPGPPAPPSVPPFDGPNARKGGYYSTKASPSPRSPGNDARLARPVRFATRRRQHEGQRSGKWNASRSERAPAHAEDDSEYISEDSYHDPPGRQRRSDSGSSYGPGSPASSAQKKAVGRNSAQLEGDSAARRKHLNEHFHKPEKSDLVRKMENAITPLRVGIFLGCFDLIGGTLTIWMTKRRAAKEKEAEAEKLALAAQAAVGAGEEPVAPRDGERKERERMGGKTARSSREGRQSGGAYHTHASRGRR